MIRLLKISGLLLLGTALSRGAMFVINVIAARLLNLETFGQYMFIRSSVAVVDAISTSSIGNVALKQVAYARAHDDGTGTGGIIRNLLLLNFSLTSTLAGVVLLSSDYAAELLLLQSADTTGILKIGALLVVISPVASLLQKILIGLENYRRPILAGIAVSTISVPLAYFLTDALGLSGILLAICAYFILDSLAKIGIIVVEQRARRAVVQTFDRPVRNGIQTKQMGALAASAFGTAFIFWFLRVQTIRDEVGFRSVAAFDAAYQAFTVIMIITGAMTSVTLQMMASNAGKKGAGQRNVFLMTLCTNVVTAISMAIAFSVLSKPLMALFGDAYVPYHSVIYVLSFVAVLATIASFLEKVLIAASDGPFLMLCTVSAAVSALTYLLTQDGPGAVLRLGHSYLAFYAGFTILAALRIFRSRRYQWIAPGRADA